MRYNTGMFAHLSVRSSFSLLDSTIRVEALAAAAAAMGYEAVALTDHNVLHGCAAFQRACEKHGVRPLFGMEADCLYHEQVIPFVLLAKDNAGYAALMRLSTLMNTGQRPCTVEELAMCTHCFVIAYGEGGYADSALIAEARDELMARLREMQQELPPFDMAISYQDASLWRMKNQLLKRCCRVLNIPTVALNKIYYLQKEDEEIYQILTGIRTQKTLQDRSLLRLSGRYLLSPEEMRALYDEDDLARTEEIASQCGADLKLPLTSLPAFPVPGGLTSEQYLTQLCLAGLQKRQKHGDEQTYLRRLQYELSVITKMHFEDYFLIVWDFIREARKRGIHVGPGRGSAAGSLVSYCLGITQIDPLRYNLLFERFLNPDRISMPDIDTDIPDNRRQEVIDYVVQKYGRDHIANIITFGTLGAKQVIRDVGKVMNIPSRDTDMLARMIPNTPRITLNEALQRSPRLKQIVGAEERYKKLFHYALRLEGLPRHASIHAAGIIMSSLSLEKVIPLTQLDEVMYTSQFTMEYLEERGLIKFDFLGLRNLSIIDEIVRKIRINEPSFRLADIPLDDAKTYQLLSNVDTLGVFQLDSDGMKNLLRKVQPREFNDIVIVLALFRPASMKSIPLYLENRAHPDHIVYPSKELEPVLQETCGVMMYQEQAMLTARIAAGFSLARADVLRKAISKKKESELAGMRNDFIRGCVKNGYTAEKAEELFTLIDEFGGYGFNKSHAVAYGLIAYQMAYLKSRYPMEFYTSLLDGVIGDDTKTMQYVMECRRRGISVLYPDVTVSTDHYLAEGREIRMPLTAVKGIGLRMTQDLIAARTKQPYDDFFDFVARALTMKITRKMLETLIYAGALDVFGYNRTTMAAALDDAVSYAELIRIERNGVTTIDLGLVSRPAVVRRQDDRLQLAEMEKEALGFTLGPHPIIEVRRQLRMELPTLARVKTMTGQVEGFGQILNVHQHRTRKGDMMAFVKLSDETGELDLAVMPKLYDKAAAGLIKGRFIRFHGKMGNDASVLADRIIPVEVRQKGGAA